jgi:hypothetical protein
MVVLSIESIGEEKFIRGFTRIEAGMKDLSDAFKLVHEDFRKVVMQIFAHEGTPEPFKPLSPEYAAWKAVHYPGQPIMRRTDALYRAMTGDTADTVNKISANEAEFGTTLKYATYQYYKGRKIVQLTEAVKTQWGRIIHRWALDFIKRSIE